jgi:N-methylhydantoinase A
MPDLAVQIVNVSVTAVGVLPRMTPGTEAGVSGAPSSPQTECDAIFERDEAPVAFRVPRYRRDDLGPGAELRGPCIVDQLDTTVVVPPGWRARARDGGQLVLDRGAEEVPDGHHHA